ncbi:uncharacterized protein LOC116306064 [Actinia tenebrosa]|uniref:Uncharacterized protein LOC116306064 n=1 Tax=Actinia tenebrosa TaxID=6105 RepID=A0A6P8J2S7_ACTTE|nr:uncharacterized protein LOC116306064 [Actinia tenebrosa]
MNNSFSTTTHSFNLFIESKGALKEAIYISIGVLAALICVGLVVDKIFRRAESHKTEEQELKVHEDDDIMEDIAKGKEMLKELQLLHQRLEQKINLNSARKRKSEISK